MNTLQEFAKEKEYLICVDSDGCAMDTMDCKHIRCFGPCMVDEWNLQPWESELLKRWNDINLYTMTRGINRFKGLAMALAEIDQTCCPIEGIAEFSAWTERAPELSNQALQAAITTAKGSCFAKALSWSLKVNAEIEKMPDSEKLSFPGVLAGLAAAHALADVAVVSSANREAVTEEWQRCGLLEHVDALCCQDVGSKAHIIAQLLQKGYAADHILMVGDAPGDQAAAQANGVYFYPILVRSEHSSWHELVQTALPHFTNGSYEAYGQQKLQQFFKNLGG